MNLITRIIVMVIAMVSLIYVIYKLNTKGIDPAFFYLDPAQTASFNPNDVTHFEWKSTTKIFSYDKDNAGRWLPEKNEKPLKNLLSFLSQIQLNQVEQKGASSLDVALDIKGERWTGAWDGLSFIWKTGPQAGKGEILKDQKNMVFFKGAHIFETAEINLCKSRVTKIDLQAFGKNYQIEQLNRGWEVVSPEKKALDPIFIEKWLISLCDVKVKTILDLSYAQSNTQRGAVTFEFVNGEKLSLQQVEKDFFVKGKMGLVLDHLGADLENLKNQLQPASNP